MDKFTSFEDLKKIKNNFEDGPEEVAPMNEEVKVEKHQREIPKEHKEEFPKLGVGDIISGVIGEEPIASWEGEPGRFFTRVSNTYRRDGKWTAVENSGYGGKGLIVFLDKQPRKGDRIRITNIFEKSARGIVI